MPPRGCAEGEEKVAKYRILRDWLCLEEETDCNSGDA